MFDALNHPWLQALTYRKMTGLKSSFDDILDTPTAFGSLADMMLNNYGKGDLLSACLGELGVSGQHHFLIDMENVNGDNPYCLCFNLISRAGVTGNFSVYD